MIGHLNNLVDFEYVVHGATPRMVLPSEVPKTEQNSQNKKYIHIYIYSNLNICK